MTLIIKIKKLNNERDYVINTDDKCNIFVGNNGSGKSTAMNILFCLFEKNMGLLNYCFDEIEISNNQTKMFQTIKYSDILPTIDLYKKLYLENEMIYLEPKDKNEEKDIYDNRSNKDFLKKHIYNIFINENDFFEFTSNLTEYKKYDLNNHKKLFMQTSKYFLSRIETHNSEFLIIKDNVVEEKPFFQTYLSFLSPSIKYSLLKILNDNQQLIHFLKQFLYTYHRIYYYYHLHNYIGKILDPILMDSLTRLFFMEQYNSMIKNEKIDEHYNYVVDCFKPKDNDDSFKNQLENYKKYLLNNRPEMFASLYVSPNIIVRSEINLQPMLSGLLDPKGQFIEEFIQDYILFIREYQYSESYKYEYDKNIMLIYEYYIEPFIGKGSLLDYSKANQFFDRYKYDMIYELVNKFKDKIINYVNDKLKDINELIKEYFTDKYIFLTPNGVVISKSYEFSDDINFAQLSIGEKRVLALIIYCYYCEITCYENTLILIDEPESSLSVILQKRLLPDLLKSNNNFLIATQSPYIVDNYEELFKYITWVNGDDSSE